MTSGDGAGCRGRGGACRVGREWDTAAAWRLHRACSASLGLGRQPAGRPAALPAPPAPADAQTQGKQQHSRLPSRPATEPLPAAHQVPAAAPRPRQRDGQPLVVAAGHLAARLPQRPQRQVVQNGWVVIRGHVHHLAGGVSRFGWLSFLAPSGWLLGFPALHYASVVCSGVPPGFLLGFVLGAFVWAQSNRHTAVKPSHSCTTISFQPRLASQQNASKPRRRPGARPTSCRVPSGAVSSKHAP